MQTSSQQDAEFRGVDKVTAFVTREDRGERELLVFRHPHAGLQLPAGTVEPGEAIERAVLREVYEETGLTQVLLAGRLATIQQPLGSDGQMITTAVPLRVEPSAAAARIAPLPLPTVSVLGRGLIVRQIRDGADYAVQAGYVQIGYDHYDIRSSHEWVLIETIVGWVPREAITADVRRHLFHLRTTAPTPDRWVHHGDVRGCELFWVPISRDAGLVRGQDAWLTQVWEQLGQNL